MTFSIIQIFSQDMLASLVLLWKKPRKIDRSCISVTGEGGVVAVDWKYIMIFSIHNEYICCRIYRICLTLHEIFLFYPKKTVKLEAWTIAGKVSKYEVFSGPYFPVFGPKKLRIWTLFTQWA